MSALRQKRSFAIIAIRLPMDQTAIQPDFMPHADAGPQSSIGMSDGGVIMGGLKPHLAENVVTVSETELHK